MLFLFIFAFTTLCGLVPFLPWYVMPIIAFVSAILFGKNTWQTVWSGFGGVFAAWVLLALLKSIPNENMLAGRVAALFHLPHWTLLLLIMGLLGGLVGGLAALSGFLVKQAFEKPTSVRL
ncbi:hypothetical protein KHS38_00310 [Mucilaginibacter sp. Bleaf8]|uniref:hypothetical protein n=1 Tax=Mucilaginibacter sp. Bleaf8 TaxID=2834430 RepID=UPI001BCC3C46|nr:hypothetical protein [Mucilaginibacter sp. Bleaf8]MBS7562832.1 hypothetical protein [Mucilaginibacter sp. Bleaf8]